MIIYRTVSPLQLILSFLFKAGYLIGAGIALYHYNDNPVVTVIIASVCILFFVVTGTDEIIVQKDFIQYKSGSILKMLREKKQFDIREIKSVNVEGNYDTGSELSTYRQPRDSVLNKFEITLKDGRVIVLTTSIYIEKLRRAIVEIDKLIVSDKRS